MAEPQTTASTPPTSAGPANATPVEGAKPETPAKSEQPQAKAPDSEKKDRKQEEPESVLREVGARLQEAAANLASSHSSLSQEAVRLAQGSRDDARLNQRSYQHELAYAVQDVEKARGAPLNLSDQARTEVTRLANSAPGLENERLLDLLRSTSKLSDQKLVDDIRRVGIEVGQSANQTAPVTLSRVETLEARSRVGARTGEEQVAPTPPGEAVQPGRRDAPPRADTATSDGHVRPSGNGGPASPQIVIQEQGGSALNGMLRAMRQSGPSNTPPWEAGAQPLGERLSAFEQKLSAGKDDAAIRSAEKSGRAALDAMEGFRTGEGAVILNRINDAAKTDPNGMAGVLSEMREGGRFADLRKQFNTALNDERGASAAYDKAASALSRYGEDRKAVDQVIARRPDATNLSAKFEEMDKEIGTAARDIPSRRDGKSMMEDLGKQVTEMLQKAVDSIKSVFTGRPSDRATPSGPSPSP